MGKSRSSQQGGWLQAAATIFLPGCTELCHSPAPQIRLPPSLWAREKWLKVRCWGLTNLSVILQTKLYIHLRIPNVYCDHQHVLTGTAVIRNKTNCNVSESYWKQLANLSRIAGITVTFFFFLNTRKRPSYLTHTTSFLFCCPLKGVILPWPSGLQATDTRVFKACRKHHTRCFNTQFLAERDL